MARDDGKGRRDGEDPAYWSFPSLETRKWQQFRTINRQTGEITVSRTCTRCKQYTLVRFKPGEEGQLDEFGRRFVESNRTKCEPDNA